MTTTTPNISEIQEFSFRDGPGYQEEGVDREVEYVLRTDAPGVHAIHEEDEGEEEEEEEDEDCDDEDLFAENEPSILDIFMSQETGETVADMMKTIAVSLQRHNEQMDKLIKVIYAKLK